MAKEASERLLEDVRGRLAASAKEETRAWFEETARHLGRWRGNEADACGRAVREACEASRADASAEPASVSGEARYRAAFELMRSEFCDDKLAGMILFEEHVLPDPSAASFLFPPEPAGARTDDADASGRELTDGFPALRDARLAFEDPGDSGVHDWSTCDWMAAKVLGPYVAAHPRPRDAARALMTWAALPTGAATPWMRRAGLTSFVNLVDGDGEPTLSPRMRKSSSSTPPPSSSRVEPAEGRARGGDALFGDGFVLELASACGAALGVGDSRVPSSSSSLAADAVLPDSNQDQGETADPTGDPEAWVRVGARWMLSLCVRECERAEAERRAPAKTSGEENATRTTTRANATSTTPSPSPMPTKARSKRRRVGERVTPTSG